MITSDSDDESSHIAPHSITDSGGPDSNSDTSSPFGGSSDEDSNASLTTFVYTGGGKEEVPEGVQYVRVESSVKRIRRKAFQWNFRLRAVELNEGLEVICQDAFNNCECLSQVKIPSTVNDIKRGSFYECRNLLEVKMPDGLQIIGARAFAHCSNLTRVKIPSSVKIMRTGTFYHCAALVAVELNEGLQRIESLAFESCENLRSIRIPSTVRAIGELAFQRCSSLVAVVIETGLEMIENCAFRSCRSLRMIKIPLSVRMIDPYAFCWCENLMSVEFAPSGSLFIGAATFHGCESLSNMLLEPHIRTIRGLDIFQSPDLEMSPSPLQEVYPDSLDNHASLLQALRVRLDDLPVHKICYHQAHYPTSTTVGLLREAMQNDPSAAEKVDVFGMTPCHVLALSTEPDFKLFKTLLEWFPPSYACQKDAWDKTPMDYLVRNQSARQTMYRVFRLTIFQRGKRCFTLNRWSLELKDEISNLVKRLRINPLEPNLFGSIYGTLAKYETMEALSLLELALWKVKTKEMSVAANAAVRQECRFTCGSHIVIPNVLAFLMKRDEQGTIYLV
eukprot:scaffold5772_cov101-Cylindrotheca_fusiformis.AAC.2